MYGLTTVFTALWRGTSVSFLDAGAPITGPSIMRAMKAVRPETVYCVPYALKLLAETPGGVDELRRAQSVMYSGAACPKHLGDQLVREGVNLAGTFGSTEVGAIMTSVRSVKDKDWDYMSAMPS
jgi:acyl-coenzyme A synthetase/AMP-(fatty) acid ligase